MIIYISEVRYVKLRESLVLPFADAKVTSGGGNESWKGWSVYVKEAESSFEVKELSGW